MQLDNFSVISLMRILHSVTPVIICLDYAPDICVREVAEEARRMKL